MLRILTLLTALFISYLPAIVSAQEDVQHGEIQFEGEERKKNPYNLIQDEVIAKIENLYNFSSEPLTDTNLSDFTLNQEQLVYLNSLYLYCAVNRGVCPSVLDTVLEFDVVSSRLEGAVSCKNMKHFWKLWIENDMQKRHQYQTKTSFIRKTNEFKKKNLPTYLRCSGTVEKIAQIEDQKNNQEFFVNRYKESSKIEEAIKQTLEDVKLIKKEKVNLHLATGSRS